MKIFNWVHRKFHKKEEDAQREVKITEVVTNDVAIDKHALIEHISQMNVLDGWKDGLLTIGTLGFDSLKDLGGHYEEQEYSTSYYHHNEEFLGDKEDHEFNFEIEEEESEMDPLVFKAFKHGHNSDFKANVSKGHHDFENYTCIGDLSSCKNNYVPVCGNLEYELEREKKGERITLADLFSADPHHLNYGKDKGDHQRNINIKKKIGADCHVKKGISFPKKVIPQSKEDLRPIQKLLKLMTKMVKRKIHPDLHSKETQLGVVNKEGCGRADQSLSLLHTQAVVT